jgi:hypothetical protein
MVETEASGNQHQSYVNQRDPCLPLTAEFNAMLPPYVDHERRQSAQQKEYKDSIQ